MPSASPETPYLPGDIIVMPVSSGFLLGRRIPKIGPGPWWTYITIVNDLDVAVGHARALARAEGVGAWLQKGRQ
jgi:hypothetical protein